MATATAEAAIVVDAKHSWMAPDGEVHERRPFRRLLTRCGADTTVVDDDDYTGFFTPRPCLRCAEAREHADRA